MNEETVTDEVRQERESTCFNCEHNNHDGVSTCVNYINQPNNIILLIDTTCPEGKW